MGNSIGNIIYSSLSGHSSRAVLPILLFIITIISGCDPAPAGVGGSSEAGRTIHTRISVKSSGAPPAGLDIFVFRDGDTKSLDSYSRGEFPSGGILDVVSGSGDKILAVLANARLSASELAQIRNYEDLEALTVDFRTEKEEELVMSGECVFCAGQDGPWVLTLEPIASKISIRMLSCMLGGDLKGQKLENVKVYLTNVSGICQPLRRDGFRPADILNGRRLRNSDLEGMSSPGLILRTPDILRETTSERVYDNFSLFCYPNDALEESAGSPFTRLVIQGDILGRTCYYPIDINRDGYGYCGGRPGIGRNVEYVMDISITRPGSPDPETPVDGSSTVTQGSAVFHPGDFISAVVGQKVRIWCEVYPEDTPVEFDYELLQEDVARGIYTYEIEPNGHGLSLDITGRGSGMVYMEVGGIVNQAFLCVIVVK